MTVATERLLRDVHPAEVYYEPLSAKPLPARVFVTTERVQVWVEQGSKIVQLFDLPLTGEAPEADRGTLFGQLHLEVDGGTVHVTKAPGCGCGSPLKALGRPAEW